MSTFAVKVFPLSITPHPNADLLALAGVGDYRAVVGKDTHQTGDLGVYIPEAAVLPEAMIEHMGLTGKLAGSAHNRVKAVRLRQELSQGIVFALTKTDEGWTLTDPTTGAVRTVVAGDDVTEFLGIVKYEPVIPASMAGEVYNIGLDVTIAFDVENIKLYPHVFQEGEMVVLTEKLHGTFVTMGYLPPAFLARHGGHPDNARLDGVPGEGFVTSKGMGAKGLALKHNDQNTGNIYVRAFHQLGMLEAMARCFADATEPVLMLGEIFGPGVQDLAYGQTGGAIAFCAFDIMIGTRDRFTALDDAPLDEALGRLGMQRVPVLDRAPFSKDLVAQWTTGKETVSGKAAHLREGVVIKPVVERRDNDIGRVLLKSVSPDYLLRKGNATEYS